MNKSQNSVSPEPKSKEDKSNNETPRTSYYYDDSTGYEIYEDSDDPDDVDSSDNET